jgi:hypothetical protein
MKTSTANLLATRAFGRHLRAMLLIILPPLCWLLFFCALSVQTLYAQKVAVIGIDATNGTAPDNTTVFTQNDGFSFVATQNLTAGSVIYFTNAYYKNTITSFRKSTNLGDDPNKWGVKYTVPTGGLTKGTVVKLVETTSSSIAFDITRSSGSCGITKVLSC